MLASSQNVGVYPCGRPWGQASSCLSITALSRTAQPEGRKAVPLPRIFEKIQFNDYVVACLLPKRRIESFSRAK
jgi:hypothetical protein